MPGENKRQFVYTKTLTRTCVYVLFVKVIIVDLLFVVAAIELMITFGGIERLPRNHGANAMQLFLVTMTNYHVEESRFSIFNPTPTASESIYIHFIKNNQKTNKHSRLFLWETHFLEVYYKTL